MLTDLECPACHHKITLSVSAPPVGQVRCPSCQTLITVTGTQIDGSTEPSPGQPSTLDKPGSTADGLHVSRFETVDGAVGESGLPAAGVPLPSHVGRFEIRRELGEGAFGKVYEAHDPQLDRAVALKVAKLGRGDSAERIGRFLREAKAAANLRHPNIVPLYEYGQDGDQFYIASAFIRGTTLAHDLHARKHAKPDLARAVRLIRKLADALNYAHCHGIVHRDVKPSNTMLDEQDEPMVLDFGLATRQEEAEKLTHAGQVVGTPRYMAPEQAKGKSGPTMPASDQYSLGVMLFEMITGEPLFEGTIELVMFHHLESEPARPRSINPDIPRDLETICLKCLEKDPGRRYANTAELAEDLRRFEAGEPIRARRVKMVERLLKWSQRNRGVAMLTGTVALLMIVGTIVSSALAAWALNEANRADGESIKANLQAQIAKENELKAKANEQTAKENAKKANDALVESEKQQKAAEAEKARAERVREYLVSLFLTSDPTGLSGAGLLPAPQAGKEASVREIMQQGRNSIDKLQADPLTQAALLDTIGNVSRTLGEYEQSLPMLKQAFELRQKHLEPGHPDIATSLVHLGNWHAEKGFVDKAEDYYLDALAIHQKRGTVESVEGAELQLRYAALLISIGGEPMAEKLARDGLNTRVRLLGRKHRDTLVAKILLLAALFDAGKYAEAVPMAAEAMAFLQQTAGTEKGGVLEAISDFQQGLIAQNLKLDGVAEGCFRSSVQAMEKNLGKDHVYNTVPLSELGRCLLRQKNAAEAEAIFRQSLDITRRSVGLGHPRSRLLVEDYADLLASQKRVAEGQALMEEMLAAQEKRFGKSFRWRIQTLCVAGQFAAANKLTARADHIAADVTQLLDARSSPLTRSDIAEVGEFAKRLGDAGDMSLVTNLYTAFFHLLEKHPSSDHRVHFANYGKILTQRGQHKEAIRFLEETLAHAKGGTPRATADVHDAIAMAHWSLGNFPDAEKSLAISADLDARHAFRLVVLRVQQARYADALEALRRYQHGTLSDVDRAWATHGETLLHQLKGDFKLDDMKPKLMKLRDASKKEDVASYRARALASSGDPAVKHEAELVKVWCHGAAKLHHPFLARALCLSRIKDDAAVLAALHEMPASVLTSADLLKGTLHSLAKYRLDKSPATRNAMEKSLDVSENHLLAVTQSRHPRIGGYVTSLNLDLAWLCTNLRQDYFDAVENWERVLASGDTKDRVTNKPSLVHEIRLQAGVRYLIHMKSLDFDSFLRLEDGAGVEMVSDDNGGGGLHARIDFQPADSATYRIIVSSSNDNTGTYQLRVLRAKN